LSNANFITYGTTADTFLPASTNQNQCVSSIPLNFAYPYFSAQVTSVSVCQQAYIRLNSNSTTFTAAAVQTTALNMTNWGTVSYRTFNNNSTLMNLSAQISCAFSAACVFNFLPTNGFVATWNHMPFNSTSECNAQIILVTDGYYSFLAMNFGPVSLYNNSFYTNSIATFQFKMNTSLASIGQAGIYSFMVNGAGEFVFLKQFT
jgi:hypothetical protein